MQTHRSPGRSLTLTLTLLLLALTATLASAQTGPVQYGYDELGRLTIVVDGAGNAAIYATTPSATCCPSSASI